MALFVGHLSRETTNRDLEQKFKEYGAITRCDLKQGYGFIEYQDSRDAEDAIKGAHNASFLGNKIVVEWAKGGSKGDRDRGDRGGDRGGDRRRGGKSDGCYNCGKPGHFARNCPSSRRSPRSGGRGGYSRNNRHGSRSPRRHRSGDGDRDRRRRRSEEKSSDNKDSKGQSTSEREQKQDFDNE